MNSKEPSTSDHDMKVSKKVFGSGRVFKQKYGDGDPKFFINKKFKDTLYMSVKSFTGIKITLHVKFTEETSGNAIDM